MSNLSKTIQDIVSGEIGQVSLRETSDLTYELKKALSRQTKHIAANDNKVSLEDFGFKKIVPAFVESENPKYGFVQNYAGDTFYAIPARPLKSFENLTGVWNSALKGVGFGALSAFCASQAYFTTEIAKALQSTNPTATTVAYISAAAGGFFSAGAAVTAFQSMRAAYKNAAVDTLGVGIRIYEDYADYISLRKSEQDTLQMIIGSNIKPVLFKA